eukprot:1315845-Pleurochrysis_carterae.AAC.2
MCRPKSCPRRNLSKGLATAKLSPSLGTLSTSAPIAAYFAAAVLVTRLSSVVMTKSMRSCCAHTARYCTVLRAARALCPCPSRPACPALRARTHTHAYAVSALRRAAVCVLGG